MYKRWKLNYQELVEIYPKLNIIQHSLHWKLCITHESTMGVRRKFSRGVGNVDILLKIFRLLTIQCKWTFIKRFTLSTRQKKLPMIRQQWQKCASLTVMARCITIIYTRLHNLFATAGRITFIFTNYDHQRFQDIFRFLYCFCSASTHWA